MGNWEAPYPDISHFSVCPALHRSPAGNCHFHPVAPSPFHPRQCPGRDPRALQPSYLSFRAARGWGASGDLAADRLPQTQGGFLPAMGPGRAGVRRTGPRVAVHTLHPRETPNTRTRTFSLCYRNAFLNLLSYLTAWGREQLHFAQSKNKIHCIPTI